MRKSPDWFVRITLGALGLFAAAILIGSAISGASATEKPCMPFKDGVDFVAAAAKKADGKMTVIPPKNMKGFSAAMAKGGHPISGDAALVVEMPNGSTALFVKHSDQLCLEGVAGMPKKADAPAKAPDAKSDDGSI